MTDSSGKAAGQPPACNTGVVGLETRSNDLERVLVDWIATTHDVRGSGTTLPTIVDTLVSALKPAAVIPSKGLQGWSESVQLYDGDGYKLGQVYFGGDRPDVHVVSTSSVAQHTRPLVTSLFGAKTSRIDTRVDTLQPFEELDAMLRAAVGRKANLRTIHSEKAGVSTGRTLYLGSPSSMVQVRLYEKALESPGQYIDGTNRVEVQLRPPSRAKAMVSTWTPTEAFCATKLTRRVATGLGIDVVEPATMQKDRGTPDLERTLEYMARQYGPACDRWLQATGGDLDTVLDHLLGRSKTHLSLVRTA